MEVGSGQWVKGCRDEQCAILQVLRRVFPQLWHHMFAKDGVRNMQLQHCSSKPDFVPFELPELLGLSWTPKGLQPPHVALEQMLTGVVPEREREREGEHTQRDVFCFIMFLGAPIIDI